MKLQEKQTKTAGLLLAATLLVVIFGGIGCLKLQTTAEQTEEIDTAQIIASAKENGLIMSDEEIAQMVESSKDPHETGKVELTPLEVEEMLDADYEYSGALADVTGGKSYGMAHANFDQGKFDLRVKIGNMPELEEGQYFEAWLVDRSAHQRSVSLGQFVQDEMGNYYFVFRGGAVLLDYEFFVVTMEWDDEDVSAGLHVLEGVLKR
jgi:hypothetical protein